MKLSRRPASQADTEFARETHHIAFRDVVERQFSGWDEVQQDRFFFEGWAPERTEIVLADGQPCGYLTVEHLQDCLFVVDVIIRPEFQNRGIGTALLEEVIALTRKHTLPVRLRVLHQNRAAELYRRLGFKEYGRTETHILMERRHT